MCKGEHYQRRFVDEIRPLVSEKRQQILTEVTSGLYIEGDASMLAVLIRNLLDNAVRYSPDGAAISVTLNSDGMAVRLSVENEGVQQTEEQCQRIFEPFYRGKENVVQGSGLGLSIVAWIVKQHSATITCTSIAQKTSIIVNFPSEKVHTAGINL